MPTTSPLPALSIDQPDLFVGTIGELRTEIRQHGGGAPPRYVAPPIEDVDARADAGADFSPVQIAERLRAYERDFGVVQIRRVSLNQLARQLL